MAATVDPGTKLCASASPALAPVLSETVAFRDTYAELQFGGVLHEMRFPCFLEAVVRVMGEKRIWVKGSVGAEMQVQKNFHNSYLDYS